MHGDAHGIFSFVQSAAKGAAWLMDNTLESRPKAPLFSMVKSSSWVAS